MGNDLVPYVPPGRPTDYSDAVADLICERLSGGESLRSICRDPEMPGMTTVFRWLSKHKQFRNQYTLAREFWAEATFEETIEIADDGRNDTYTDDKGNEIVNHDVIARSRLRVDTRKWAMARMNWRRFGDKVEATLKGDKDSPLEQKITVFELVPFTSAAPLPRPKGPAES